MIPGTSLCAPYRVLLLVYDRATRLCQLKRSRCYIFLSPHRVLCTTNTVLFIVQPAVLKCRSVSQIIPGDVAININIVTNNSHWLCRGTASTEYLVHTNNTNHTPKSQTNSGVSVLLLRPLLLLAVSFWRRHFRESYDARIRAIHTVHASCRPSTIPASSPTHGGPSQSQCYRLCY